MKREIKRGSFVDCIRVDLVCGMKMHYSKKFVIKQVCQDREITKRFVQSVYDATIRPRLRAGERIKDLF